MLRPIYSRNIIHLRRPITNLRPFLIGRFNSSVSKASQQQPALPPELESQQHFTPVEESSESVQSTEHTVRPSIVNEPSDYPITPPDHPYSQPHRERVLKAGINFPNIEEINVEDLQLRIMGNGQTWYHIERSAGGELPVYREYQRGPKQVWTIIKNIKGDALQLKEDLTRVFQADLKETQRPK